MYRGGEFAKSPQVFSVTGQPWDGPQPVLCNNEATALIAPTRHLFYKRTWPPCAWMEAHPEDLDLHLNDTFGYLARQCSDRGAAYHKINPSIKQSTTTLRADYSTGLTWKRTWSFSLCRFFSYRLVNTTFLTVLDNVISSICMQKHYFRSLYFTG